MIIQGNRMTGSWVILIFYIIGSQDLLCSILFKFGVPPDIIKLCTILKEIIIILVGLPFIFRTKVSPGRLLIIVFFLYTSVFLLVSDLTIYYSLLGYRTYVLIFFSFIIGETVGRERSFEARFMKHAGIIFSAVAVFSFLEYFILPKSIWKTIFPVLQMKEQALGLIVEQYFDTGSPVNAFGELVNRMVGPFNDPLTLSYFIIIIVNFFIAQLIYKKHESSWRTILGVTLIFLTQTRAMILGLVLSIAGILLKDLKLKKKHLTLMLGSMVLVLFGVIIFWNFFAAFFNSIFTSGGRNIGHLDAYSQGIKTILKNPFGYGMGSSSVTVNFVAGSSGTENTFINLAIECGIVGLLLFWGILFYLFLTFKKYLSKKSVLTPGYFVVAAGFLLLIQYSFAGFVAPHIFIARIVIPFMIVIGWAYSIANRKQE
jgi:hypothetical protein